MQYKEQEKQLRLLVVEGGGPSLFGRDCLRELAPDWGEIKALRTIPTDTTKLKNVLQKHTDIFKDELGLVRGTAAKIHVDPQVQPRFFQARSVPYALQGKVELELERLEKEGVIEPVQFSDSAAPIVPVVKRDGSIRICGDYKMTINKAAKLDTYPLPRIEGLFASLAGGKSFTKLDLAHVYQQLELDNDSKKFTTINTSRGLYQYNRLPFGVASVPSTFQRTSSRACLVFLCTLTIFW